MFFIQFLFFSPTSTPASIPRPHARKNKQTNKQKTKQNKNRKFWDKVIIYFNGLCAKCLEVCYAKQTNLILGLLMNFLQEI